MRAVLLCLLIGVALVPWPAAPAQTTVNLTVEALESGCPSGKTYCFKETSGNLDDVQPGSVVKVTFTNKGTTPHEVTVVDYADRNPEHRNTPRNDSLGASERNMAGDATDEFEFTVPSDATGLYLWCSVPGHEQLGMWLEQSFSGGNGETTSKGSPGVGAIGLLVALGVALVALGARRK